MTDFDPMDYSKTERIVLLLDLNPLLHLQDPTPYFTSLLTSSKILLSFPPLSNSLFSFKLFFSSLSPLLSSSTLTRIPNKAPSCTPNSLYFDRPRETLISLSQTLDSITGLLDPANGECPSRVSFTSSSVYQIVHDYAWEVLFQDPVSGQCGGEQLVGFDFSGVVRSSLVVMYSSICRSFKGFCDYMGVDEGIGDRLLNDSDAFYDKFKEVFRHVKGAFDCRDIHFSWVDVGYGIGCDNTGEEADRLLKLFQSGIRRLGWGLCSAESIMLGSALVPFGLVYPLIGVTPKLCVIKDYGSNIKGKLNLEILDVNGKPLECTLCDLRLHQMNLSPRDKCAYLPHNSVKLDDDSCEQSNASCRQFGDGITKIDVKSVEQCSENVKFVGSMFDLLLVHEFAKESKNSAGVSDQFFADRVLQMLSKDEANVLQKSAPLWQILMSYLYRRGYCALVCMSVANGGRYIGILKPHTVHSAMLFVIKNVDDSLVGGHDHDRLVWSKLISKSNADMGCSKGFLGSGEKRKKKGCPLKFKDLSWSSFCRAANEDAGMELEEAYSDKFGSSKKLKFLKCWMKQVEKNSYSRVCKVDQSAICDKDPEIVEDRLSQVHEQSEQPLALAFSVGHNDSPEPCELEEDMNAASLAVPEDFFTNLCQRIEHGIQSGLDLVALAHRLVFSSILCLNKKVGVDSDQGSQASVENIEESKYSRAVVAELSKILLKDPKDLAVKHRDDQPSKVDEGNPTKHSSKEKVREYELQVLFRMEMLQSEVATGIKQSMKLKLVNEICSLLEMLQFHVDGGVLGNFNLNDYVGRVIRSRYSETLGDVIHTIQEQLDLFLFDNDDDDDDGLPNPLLDSEDSGQSWREKPGRVDLGDNERTSESFSVDDSLTNHMTNSDGSNIGCRRDEYVHRLAEAQEKRQKACRLSSFTRGMADLKKVWAPKQQKLSRSLSESLQRRSKRKDRQRKKYDIVSETPMTVNKRSCLGNGSGGDEGQELRSTSSGSVYKSLFQDDF